MSRGQRINHQLPIPRPPLALDTHEAPEPAKALTCQSCRHWHDQGANPANLQEHNGQCLRYPPQAFMFPQPNGQLAAVSTYPTTPVNALACGEYEERE